MASVYDGDTITCAGGTRVRLLGIDTPEMNQGDFGRHARGALLELAPLGSVVLLEGDVEPQDRYGRTLAYAWTEGGRMVDEELARRGYALSLTYAPDGKHVERLHRAAEAFHVLRVQAAAPPGGPVRVTTHPLKSVLMPSVRI